MDKYGFNKTRLTQRGYVYLFKCGNNEIWSKAGKNIEVSFEDQTILLLDDRQYLGVREQFNSMAG